MPLRDEPSRRSGRSAVSRITPFFALALTASLSERVNAQTSVRGVSPDRLDQNATNRPPRRPIRKPLDVPRDLNAALTPFRLDRVIVQGSTLAPAALQAATRPFVGTIIDNAALTAITNAVGSVYAKSDIALYTVMVPDQGFAGGELRLVATESYLSAVEFRGKIRSGRQRFVRLCLRRALAERPLRRSTLQRAASFLRDMPGFYPDLSFVPEPTPGPVHLVVADKDNPVQIGYGINNRGIANLAGTQQQADIYLNGLITGADQLHLTALAPLRVRRFQYYAAAYSAPLTGDGDTVTGNISYLRTRPAWLPIKGRSIGFGLQISHPFVRSYTRSLYATLGFDGLDGGDALLGYHFSNDRVRTLRTALAYTRTGARSSFSLSTTASFGLGLFGARATPGQSDRRFVKVDTKIAEALGIGKTFVLRLNAFGQATAADLPSSEQVALGGDEFGRGYPAGEILGDSGYAASAELAWRPATGLPKALAGTEIYAFSDGGRVRCRERQAAPAVTRALASIGAGFRLQVMSKTTVQVEASHAPLHPDPTADRAADRLFFSVKSLF